MGGRGSNQYQSKPGGKGPEQSNGGGFKGLKRLKPNAHFPGTLGTHYAGKPLKVGTTVKHTKGGGMIVNSITRAGKGEKFGHMTSTIYGANLVKAMKAPRGQKLKALYGL